MKVTKRDMKYINEYLKCVWNVERPYPTWFDDEDIYELEIMRNDVPLRNQFLHFQKMWKMIGRPNLMDNRTYRQSNFEAELVRLQHEAQKVLDRELEQPLTIKDVIDDFKVDGRYTSNTLPMRFKAFLKEQGVKEKISDKEILELFDFKHHKHAVKVVEHIDQMESEVPWNAMESPYLNNIQYTAMMKSRRNK